MNKRYITLKDSINEIITSHLLIKLNVISANDYHSRRDTELKILKHRKVTE